MTDEVKSVGERILEALNLQYRVLSEMRDILTNTNGYGSNTRQDIAREGRGERGVGSESPSGPGRPKGRPNNNYSNTFEQFWAEYPKKLGKGNAWKKWKTNNCDQYIAQILEAIPRFMDLPSWRKDGGQFIPYPEKWLGRRSWEDDPDAAARAKDSPAHGHRIGEKWTDDDGRECEIKANGEMWRQLRPGSSHWKKVD